MRPAAAAASAHVQSGIEKPPSPLPAPIWTAANEWVWPKPSQTWYVQLPSLGNFDLRQVHPGLTRRRGRELMRLAALRDLDHRCDADERGHAVLEDRHLGVPGVPGAEPAVGRTEAHRRPATRRRRRGEQERRGDGEEKCAHRELSFHFATPYTPLRGFEVPGDGPGVGDRLRALEPVGDVAGLPDQDVAREPARFRHDPVGRRVAVDDLVARAGDPEARRSREPRRRRSASPGRPASGRTAAARRATA